jgi:hypothetical protein
VAQLIRGLRRFNEEQKREVRVFFLTASPPQIGRAIREKLQLDGIEYDSITFKDQLQNLVRGKFRNLREHVGFKLTELLKSRREMAPSRTIPLGDDWESDPLSTLRRHPHGAVDRARPTSSRRPRGSSLDRRREAADEWQRAFSCGEAHLHQPGAAYAAGAVALLRFAVGAHVQFLSNGGEPAR